MIYRILRITLFYGADYTGISATQRFFIKKFFSLWVVVYALVYILTSQYSPLAMAPFIQNFVVWFGTTFLHLQDFHRVRMTGSGDTLYNYVLTLCAIIFSFILTLAIAVLDRKRKNYRQLYLFTIVIARYYVAYTMLSYGFIKVFHGQFGPMGYRALEEKFGDMSPMAVLWNFMKASPVYSFFGGLMEVVGGLLLLFRKTRTIGALFSMTVMINVAMLNFAYDVPVKIFSTHIVLLCVFILSYEWIRLYNFFIVHKNEVLDYNRLSVKKKWLRVVLISLKGLLIAWLLLVLFILPLFRNKREAVPLEGAYMVESFILNGKILPDDTRDSVRWNKLYVSYPGSVIVREADKNTWYTSRVDTVSKKIILKERSNSSEVYADLTYSLRHDTLTLKGYINSDAVRMICTRKQKKDYPLLNRGFHWVNAYPYNR